MGRIYTTSHLTSMPKNRLNYLKSDYIINYYANYEIRLRLTMVNCNNYLRRAKKNCVLYIKMLSRHSTMLRELLIVLSGFLSVIE